ncbi:leukocyte receptor cluster member 8 homolog isoform X2 [Hetaerina americana]|uniref:leukocyte receptor cluster member 8 homolog isoform X2 n=1 Tax=Hetaerina americana TaxID=62018 RepID=UPI003A7F26A7
MGDKCPNHTLPNPWQFSPYSMYNPYGGYPYGHPGYGHPGNYSYFDQGMGYPNGPQGGMHHAYHQGGMGQCMPPGGNQESGNNSQGGNGGNMGGEGVDDGGIGRDEQQQQEELPPLPPCPPPPPPPLPPQPPGTQMPYYHTPDQHHFNQPPGITPVRFNLPNKRPGLGYNGSNEGGNVCAQSSNIGGQGGAVGGKKKRKKNKNGQQQMQQQQPGASYQYNNGMRHSMDNMFNSMNHQQVQHQHMVQMQQNGMRFSHYQPPPPGHYDPAEDGREMGMSRDVIHGVMPGQCEAMKMGGGGMGQSQNSLPPLPSSIPPSNPPLPPGPVLPPPPPPPLPPTTTTSPSKPQNIGALAAGDWPPSLKEYVDRCYRKCITPVDKDQVEIILKGKITRAANDGSLWMKDWDLEPLPSIHSERMLSDIKNSYNTASSSAESQKTMGGGQKKADTSPPLQITLSLPPPPPPPLTSTPPPSCSSTASSPSSSALLSNSQKKGSIVPFKVGVSRMIARPRNSRSKSPLESSPVSRGSSSTLQSQVGGARGSLGSRGKTGSLASSRGSGSPARNRRRTRSDSSSSSDENYRPLVRGSKGHGRQQQQRFSDSRGESKGSRGTNKIRGKQGKQQPKTNKPHYYSEYGRMTVEEDEERLQQRAARFGGLGLKSQSVPSSPSTPPVKRRRNGPLSLALPPLPSSSSSPSGGFIEDASGDLDWSDIHVVGTCRDVEKPYLRLTSAPDASSVRPVEVLRLSLARVKERWVKFQDYRYACDQLKSIRQDLTVQGVRDSFTMSVYETHARIALEKGDHEEFNQCQSQLKMLYGELPSTQRHVEGSLEFTAYRILYYVFTKNTLDLTTTLASLSEPDKKHECIAHALALRSAWSLGNYHTFFVLYRLAPRMGGYLIDWFAARERKAALKTMIKAYRQYLPVIFVAQELAFESEKDFRDFAAPFSLIYSEDGEKIDCKASMAVLPNL